jgi:hypothetical protein
MSSFDSKIETLLRHLGRPTTSVNARQGDSVYNVHYDPAEWEKLRMKLPMIRKRLEDAGFTAHVHSLADIIQDILAENSRQVNALKKLEHRPLPHKTHTETLYNILAKKRTGEVLDLSSPIVQRLQTIIQEAAKTPKSVLLITDIEMAHPLVRVSAFEQILQGKFAVPTVFFYPGKRGTVGDNPSFLGVYPSDGNYRSTHIY